MSCCSGIRPGQSAPFQVTGCDTNLGIVGQTDLRFLAVAHNVEFGPVTWTMISFGGDLADASIDPNSGEISYDAPTSLSNNGQGEIVIRATDATGQQVDQRFCISLADPTSRVRLACNADIARNLPDIQSQYVFDGRIRDVSVFSDAAGTVPANDGDTVLVWEDGNSNANATVRAGNVGPTYVVNGAPNNNDALSFSGANQSLQYDVPGAPPVGSPFKLFFLVRIAPTSNDSNATVLASTLQSNNNSLNNETWQISRSSALDFFVMRFDTPVTTVVSGSLATGSSGDMVLSTWSTARDGNWHLVYIRYDGTNVQGFFDGAMQFEAVPSSPLAAEHFKFGENRAGGNFIEMDLAELQFAGNTLSDTEATQVQAYYLCKFGLDASLISDPGPFAVNLDSFFDQQSQFEYQTQTDGTEVVYDTINNVYHQPDDVPTPDLGLFTSPEVAAILRGITVQNLQTNANTPVFTSNITALAGGLQVGDHYHTPTGEVRVVV